MNAQQQPEAALTRRQPATPVVIIGAGPTGSTAAILLGQYGIPVVVLDRWSDVYPQPRAVHLDDEVFRILSRLGVAEEFRSISRAAEGLRLLDKRYRTLAQFDRRGVAPQSGHPRANMFDQPELERILRKRMLEQESVDFRGNVEVLSIEPSTSGGSEVAYVDRDSDERTTLRAHYVLACDGANSLGRQAIGSTMQDLRFEQRWLVVDIETDADLRQWEGVHQVCDTTRAATYMRVGDRRYRWEFQLLPDETLDSYGTLNAVAPLIQPWTRDLGVDQLELVRVAEYTFRAMIADRWRDTNVFLLGDAAHLTPPFIGQGMGAGMRDAMNLAWKVAGVWEGRLPADVLGTYESERKPHARTVIRLAKLMGVLMTRGGALGDALRRMVAPRVELLPALGARVSHSETAPLRGSTWASPSRRDRLSGRLCPNAVVAGGLRFDDVTEGRFVVVTEANLNANAAKELSSRACDVLHVDEGSELFNWLRRGRAQAALVRPDGTVMKSGTASTVLGTALTSLSPTR